MHSRNFRRRLNRYAAGRFCDRLEELIVDCFNSSMRTNERSVDELCKIAHMQLIDELNDAIGMASGKIRQHWAFETTLDLMKDCSERSFG